MSAANKALFFSKAVVQIFKIEQIKYRSSDDQVFFGVLFFFFFCEIGAEYVSFVQVLLLTRIGVC